MERVVKKNIKPTARSLCYGNYGKKERKKNKTNVGVYKKI